jgi:hypothetical protein
MTFDVTLGIFKKAVFQHATREAVRFAITFSSTFGTTDCTSSQSTCIKKVVQTNAMGFLNDSDVSNYVTVKYYSPTDLTTPVTADNPSGSPPTYRNQTGNLVEVSITNYPLTWMVPLPGYAAGLSITLSATASDILQGYKAGATSPPSP